MNKKKLAAYGLIVALGTTAGVWALTPQYSEAEWMTKYNKDLGLEEAQIIADRLAAKDLITQQVAAEDDAIQKNSPPALGQSVFVFYVEDILKNTEHVQVKTPHGPLDIIQLAHQKRGEDSIPAILHHFNRAGERGTAVVAIPPQYREWAEDMLDKGRERLIYTIKRDIEIGKALMDQNPNLSAKPRLLKPSPRKARPISQETVKEYDI